jgi:sporulation protein YlmC with PRC-barrel domain
MAQTQFLIGAEVSCSDGVGGVVTRVIVDPVARALTHLVVEPKHHREIGRLVPLDLADATTSEIRLRCTLAEFDKLDPAEETDFLPSDESNWERYGDYSAGQMIAWPYYGLGPGAMGGVGMPSGTGRHVPEPVTYDSVPAGEVSVRRGEHVQATDGEIGRVQGLVIDPSNHHVTHVLLQEGHLWGRRQVTIPIAVVTKVDGGDIHLNIAKKDVEALPALHVNQHA